MYCDKGKDDEILSELHNSSNTHPDWHGPNPIGMGQNKRSFKASARVPFTTIRTNLSSGLTSRVHSHAVKVPVTSTTKVSFSDDAEAKSNSAILIDLSTSQQKAKIHFYDGSSQNESSCASLLAARAKSQSEVQRHVKFIVELVSEGAWNAPTIFQTFSSTVAFTSGAQSARASPLPVFANQTNATTKNSPKKRVHGRLINSHRHSLFFE